MTLTLTPQASSASSGPQWSSCFLPPLSQSKHSLPVAEESSIRSVILNNYKQISSNPKLPASFIYNVDSFKTLDALFNLLVGEDSSVKTINKTGQVFSQKVAQPVDKAEAELKARLILKIEREHLKRATFKDWNRMVTLYSRIDFRPDLKMLETKFESYFSRMLRKAESEEQFKEILSFMKQLPLTSISLRKLDRNEKLASKAMLTEAFMAFLGIPSLETLDVSGCKYLRDWHLDLLKGSSIKNLKASATQLTGENFDRLPSYLERLNVSKCRIKDKHLALLDGLSFLKELNLSGCKKITGSTFKQFQKSRLETLNLSNCPLVTPENLSFLSECILLKNLELSASSINENSFSKIGSLSPKELTVSGEANKHTLKHIIEVFPSLAKIHLTNCLEKEGKEFRKLRPNVDFKCSWLIYEKTKKRKAELIS